MINTRAPDRANKLPPIGNHNSKRSSINGETVCLTSQVPQPFFVGFLTVMNLTLIFDQLGKETVMS